MNLLHCEGRKANNVASKIILTWSGKPVYPPKWHVQIINFSCQITLHKYNFPQANNLYSCCSACPFFSFASHKLPTHSSPTMFLTSTNPAHTMLSSTAGRHQARNHGPGYRIPAISLCSNVRWRCIYNMTKYLSHRVWITVLTS